MRYQFAGNNPVTVYDVDGYYGAQPALMNGGYGGGTPAPPGPPVSGGGRVNPPARSAGLGEVVAGGEDGFDEGAWAQEQQRQARIGANRARTRPVAQRCARSMQGQGDCVEMFAPRPEEQMIYDLWYFANTPQAKAIKTLLEASARSLRSESEEMRFWGGSVSAVAAYVGWYNYVKKDAPLDVKGQYRQRYGVAATSSMNMFGDGWTTELSGNLLYGYVGRHVGFTAGILEAGAGVAQFQDHCLEANRPGLVGPGADGCRIRNRNPATWDQPADQAEIRVGIELYERHGDMFSESPDVTPEKLRLLEEVLAKYRSDIPKQ